MSARIRVMLVDDHAIVREGYRALLAKHADLEVVAEAADGAEAYLAAQRGLPDVVVMDLSMPGMGGLEAIARLRARFPELRILVFTMHDNPSFAMQATRAGARGYVTKSSPPEMLVRAIYEVHAGRHALSPDLAHALALRRLQGEAQPLDELTVREFEILRQLVAARSTAEIAQDLNLSPKTVANLHYAIKRKLGVGSDIELTRFALRWKILDARELLEDPEPGAAET